MITHTHTHVNAQLNILVRSYSLLAAALSRALGISSELHRRRDQIEWNILCEIGFWVFAFRLVRDCVCDVLPFCYGSQSARDIVATSMVSIYIELEPHNYIYLALYLLCIGHCQCVVRAPPVRMHLYLSSIFHPTCRYAIV